MIQRPDDQGLSKEAHCWWFQNFQKKIISFPTPHKPVELNSPNRDGGVEPQFPMRRREKVPLSKVAWFSETDFPLHLF